MTPNHHPHGVEHDWIIMDEVHSIPSGRLSDVLLPTERRKGDLIVISTAFRPRWYQRLWWWLTRA